MEKVRQRLTELLNTTQPIGIAVSGGLDSIALLHLCVEISKNIVVLHINHQTRSACNQESLFVEDICKHYHIPFVELKAEGLSLNMPDFENQARKERYRLFLEYAQKLGINTILTAHHQDDLIENVFLKILRSSLSIYIPEKRFLDEQKNISLIRPLLSLKKKKLESFLQQKGHIYIEDSSNQDTKYLRNFIRREIIPLLSDKVDHLYQKINTLVLLRQEEEEFLAQYTKNKEQEIFPNQECDVQLFLSEHPVIQSRILQNKFIEFTKNLLSYKNIKNILKEIHKTNTNAIVLWENHNFSLLKERNIIRFICKNNSKCLEKNTIIVHNNKMFCEHAQYSLELKLGCGILYSLNDEIYLRYPNHLEKFPWNTGSKLITKILQDKKIPHSKRSEAQVLVKNNETIGLFCEDFSYISPSHRVTDKNAKGLFIIKSNKI